MQNLTLHIHIDANANPRLVRVVTELLDVLSDQPSTLVSQIELPPLHLIGITEIESFLTITMNGATARQVHNKAGAFYVSLFSWTCRGRLPLNFWCTQCHQSIGNCSCPELGYETPAGQWRYHETVSTVSQWLLDPTSVLQLNIDEIVQVHRATTSRIRQLMSYLKQLS